MEQLIIIQYVKYYLCILNCLLFLFFAYVEIKDKKFQLKNNNLSNELKYLAQKYIEHANKILEQYEGQLFVDYQSKTIMGNSLLNRAPGKNDISVHWNYVRVYTDAGNLRLMTSVGLTVAGIHVSSKVIQYILGGLSLTVPHLIRDGIWFDYNYFYGGAGEVFLGPIGTALGVTQFGLQ